MRRRRKIIMETIKQILRLKKVVNLSTRNIAKVTNTPKSTVLDYIRRFEKTNLTYNDIEPLADSEIHQALFPDKKKKTSSSQSKNDEIDLNYIHNELKRRGVTRHLLWEEYRENCSNGLGYSQFCEIYRAYTKKVNISMRQVHKAGEKIFVDYSGLKAEIIDKNTGEVIKVEIFVAVLGASGYTYAEASLDQKKHSFINSHLNAFEYFGGVSEILVPDNLKSAINEANRYDPTVNESYQDMAEHYDVVVIPARPYKPKDKSKAELSVLLVQRWILARFRNRQFFSIEELNQAIKELLEILNNKIVKKFGKSRHELYEELDKPALKSLPERRYELRLFKHCRVNIDYHIEIMGSYYSVPYQLVKEEVKAVYNITTVEIYHDNKRVAIHKRLYTKGGYQTNSDHMASSHKIYAQWTPSKLINWGSTYGPHTKELIEAILATKKHPEMGFRTSLGILNNCKKYENDVVELAAKKLLSIGSYRVKAFTSILKNKTYLLNAIEDDLDEEVVNRPDNHKNIRGAAYYN